MQKNRLPVRIVIISSVASLMLIMTACQPTPEKPVVVGRNEGAMESALNRQATAEPTPYNVPATLQMEVEALPDNFSIQFDAEVMVPKQSKWPVYTVERTTIRQEDADAVRRVLLGDAVLYKPGEYRSREEIEQSINYYEKELQGSVGQSNLIDSYTKILKNLYVEYENTPEDLVLEKADTDFKFMEDQVQLRPGLFDSEKGGETGGGAILQWTDEARQAAIEAGCENIYGVCWTDSGRKMVFSAQNGSNGSNIQFYIADGNLIQDPGVSYSLDEAIEKGNELLAEMGFNFTLVEAQTWTQGEVDDASEDAETGQGYHMLTYKRSLDGVPQDNIVSCINQNIGEDYRSPIPSQETIIIQIDDDGVRLFSWNSPMTVVALENSNAPLIPFDEISERIVSQLKVETVWDENADNEAEWIDSRCLKVDKIVLSYMMVAKSNDMMNYYLIPVWNVCGDLIYHYIDSYPIGESNTWVLDENNERHPWRSRGNMDAIYSTLTINAIDGSVIPRYRWC